MPRMTAGDRNFYGGMLAALAVVAVHDQETLFREIVGTVKEEELVAAALEDESAEWAGLIQYGYCTKRQAAATARKARIQRAKEKKP